MSERRTRKKIEIPKSCASCTRYPVCYIRRDMIDMVATADSFFMDDNETKRNIHAEIYQIFGKRCNQFKAERVA